MRQTRKIDHIKYALKIPDQPEAGFADVHLLHCSLPELDWQELDLECSFLNKKIKAPIMINAMTGGHSDVLEINKNLARAAKESGLAIALGSQRAALEDKTVISTFKVVREENPTGIVIANLSAGCRLQEAAAAVEMLEADALQLHVNVPQELAMSEGDRSFRGLVANIAEITAKLSVPVIVKEVGFGMSRETVAQLYRCGVKYIDISGRGGTNFIAIEKGRAVDDGSSFIEGLNDWGIPTAVSIAEARAERLPIFIIASGGLRTSLDIAKSIALGADLTALSRPFLQTLLRQGYRDLIAHIETLIVGLKKAMLMCGAANIQQLKKVPLIITGQTKEWLTARNIDIKPYAQRKFINQ